MTLNYTTPQLMDHSRRSPTLAKMVHEELAGLESRLSGVEGSTVYIPEDSKADDTFERAIFKAPSDCVVTAVIVVPDSDIGQATDYMTLDVQDKGADGTGTTSLGLLAVNSTNTIDGMVGEDLVTTNKSVSAGRVLSLKKTVAESGQAWPGGFVKVIYTPA